MNLTLYKPFRGLSPFRSEFDRVFDNLWGGSLFETANRDLVPALDLSEDENEIRVKVELPGVEKDEVDIHLKEGQLVIEGEKKSEEEAENEMQYLCERSYGSFQRVIQMPSTVDTEKVKASFKNGILEIIIAKKEETKPKKVNIEFKK